MHYYGPYSDELNDDLVEMGIQKYIDIQPDLSGFGYHIRSGSEAVDSLDSVTKRYAENIDNCINKFGQFESRQLELLGTIHFVKHIAGFTNVDDIIEMVSVLKPVFEKSNIKEYYEELMTIMG